MSGAVSLSHDGFMRKGETSAGRAAAGFLFLFFNSDGGQPILYYTTISRNLISDKLRVYIEQKTEISAYVCICCCCVYLCLWPSRNCARLG